MSSKPYAVVVVELQNGKVVCTPKWVRLYWKTGPANIRWVFKGIPATIKDAGVEFVKLVPRAADGTTGSPFLGKGPFSGIGTEPPSGGSHLRDFVTLGNSEERCDFWYRIVLGGGAETVKSDDDPGGGNDPEPPGGGG